jgi:Zn-dependent M28 family amino/carboxypeptidase
LHHWYSPPAAEDPWYEVANLEVTLPGNGQPEEIIQLIAHKDSMSWIDSPGAHDNAVGTVASLELARVLAKCPLTKTVRLLFCNEEHTPWTSRHAADAAAARGDRIIAVMNVDSLDGKSDEDMASGRMTHTICYSTEEGRELAEQIASCAARYEIGLEPDIVHKDFVNDDDGMFIKAGFPRTVMHIGTFPYEDSQYHLSGDTPDRVNIQNMVLSTRLLLASILEIAGRR